MAEPYSARLRTHSTTLSMMVYWITTWAVGFVTPYVVDETAADLGVNIAYIWFSITIISIVWAFLCVPELSGLSITEAGFLPFISQLFTDLQIGRYVVQSEGPSLEVGVLEEGIADCRWDRTSKGGDF